MPRAAPRIDPRLVAALARLDHRGTPIAETHRALGRVADWLDLPRPSYEQVRVLVQGHRRRPIYPGVGETLLNIALRVKPPGALLDVLTGEAAPKRRSET